MNAETDITICLGSSCFSRGNKEMLDIIKTFLKNHDLEKKVFFRGELCTNRCEHGPIMRINNDVFENINTDNIFDILNEYFDVSETNN